MLIIDWLVNSIDSMVNNDAGAAAGRLTPITRLVGIYFTLVVVTLAALAVMSVVDPALATTEAWVHTAIVTGFAVLLLVRLRAARQGSRRGTVAIGIIAAVLMVANAVEAVIPGLFPTWMRWEMVGIAALMVVVVVTVFRRR